ncbi:HNH endonuclease [Nitrospinota bacterium]
MANPSYYEQLKHPRWQKKRLAILERAGFECEDCGSGEKMLHVHHSYYEKSLAPWDYPAESLHCLCVDCHKKAQDRQTLLQRQIGRLDLGDVDVLIGYAMGLESQSYPMVPLDVFSYEVALGIGNAWGITPEKIIDALEEGRIDGYKLDQLSRNKPVAGSRPFHQPERP